jgi:hypothetical protein
MTLNIFFQSLWPCLDTLTRLEVELFSNSNSIPKLTLALRPVWTTGLDSQQMYFFNHFV